MSNATPSTDEHQNNQTTVESAGIPGIDEFNNIFSILVTTFSFVGVVLNICVIRYSRKL